jgi:peroxiredoxin
LKQDYGKIRRAGAELALVSPDPPEEHRRYALALLGEELPYLFVPDTTLDIARRYQLLRKEEHMHGGFYYRSLWILDREGMITYKKLPWEVTTKVEEYQRMFSLVGAEPGEWIETCGLAKEESEIHSAPLSME